MAKRRKRSGARRKGSPRKIGGKVFDCYTKAIKNARGGKRSVRAFCRKHNKR